MKNINDLLKRTRVAVTIKMRLATVWLAAILIVLGCLNALGSDSTKIWRFKFANTNEASASIVFESPEQYFSMLQVGFYSSTIADATGNKNGPSDPKLVGIVSSLKPGDLIKLTISADNAVTQIEKYVARPGEDMPDYKEYVRMTTTTFQGQEFPAVVLRRFLKETEYPIGKMDADKKWQPDNELASKARKFVEGNAVEAGVISEEPGVYSGRFRYFLQSIDAYHLPSTGKVIKVREVPPSDDAECFTTKDRNRFGMKDNDSISLMVDLKQEGSDETNSFLAWDYNLLNEAARLKEGDKVFFKTDLKNGKKQLSELRAAAIK